MGLNESKPADYCGAGTAWDKDLQQCRIDTDMIAALRAVNAALEAKLNSGILVTGEHVYLHAGDNLRAGSATSITCLPFAKAPERAFTDPGLDGAQLFSEAQWRCLEDGTTEDGRTVIRPLGWPETKAACLGPGVCTVEPNCSISVSTFGGTGPPPRSSFMPLIDPTYVPPPPENSAPAEGFPPSSAPALAPA